MDLSEYYRNADQKEQTQLTQKPLENNIEKL